MRADISKAKEQSSPIYKSEAITRAAKALSCFSPSKAAWTLDDLSETTRVPKNTLRGILDTLVMHGMLLAVQSETYRLGYAWLAFGALRRNQFDPRTIALPIMRQIRDVVNETVILSVRVGDQRIHIDYVESTQPTRRLAQIGSSSPLHIGAAGLALLSSLSPGTQDTYLAHMKATLTPNAYRTLERTLAKTKQSGFTAVVGTVNPDTAAVSAATRLYSGECVAITISCLTERFNSKLETACANLVKDAIKQLSRDLGAGS